MRTTNPIIEKYLKNGKYSGFKSEERKKEIQQSKSSHYPVQIEKVVKSGQEPEYKFKIGNFQF